MNHELATGLLDRLLDGSLETDERDAVILHLTGCPACQAQLATMTRLHRLVRTRLFTAAVPPPDLADRVRDGLALHVLAAAPAPDVAPAGGRAGLRPFRPRWRPGPARPANATLGAVAVAALALALGGWSLGWRMTANSPGDDAAELVTQHRLFAQDDKLLEIQGEDDAVSAWFQDRMTFPVAAPALPGYVLEGGRLVAIDGRHAAQLVYEHAQTKAYVSLFIAPRGTRAPGGLRPNGPFAVGQRGDLSVVAWSDPAGRLALVAPLAEAQLLDLAGQLSFPPDWPPAGPLSDRTSGAPPVSRE